MKQLQTSLPQRTPESAGPGDRQPQAFMTPRARRPLLGELLLHRRLLTKEQLASAIERKKTEGGRLGRHLVRCGFLTERTLLEALSEQLEIPIADLDAPGVVSREAAGRCRRDIAEQWRICPVRFDERRRVLTVAVADADPRLLKDIEHLLAVKIEAVLAPGEAIDRALRRVFQDEVVAVERLDDLTVARSEARRVQTLDDLLGPSLPAPAPAPPPVTPQPAPPPTPVAPTGASPVVVRELTERVTRLEKTVASQAKAIRTLVELLNERGLLKPSDSSRG